MRFAYVRYLICAGIGVGLALLAAFLLPLPYTATAIVPISLPPVNTGLTRAAFDEVENSRLATLSGGRLAALATNFQLYRDLPVETRVERVRHDASIDVLDHSRVRVQYRHPDARTARLVAAEMAVGFTRELTSFHQIRREMFRNVWKQELPFQVAAGRPEFPAASSVNLRLLAIGILAGLAAALFLPRLLRHPVYALAGTAAGLLVWLLLPAPYRSEVTIQIGAPFAPRSASETVYHDSPTDRIQQISSAALAATPLRPTISTDFPAQGRPTIRIVCSAANPLDAQAATRRFTQLYMETYVAWTKDRVENMGQEARTMASYRLGENLEIEEPPTLPTNSARPSPVAFAGFGLAAGLLLPALRFHRRPGMQL